MARRLSSSGKRVRIVNRSGKADAPPGVDVVAADVTDPAAARRASEGAAVVFHCASGPYAQWTQALPPIMNGIIEAEAAAGARVVLRRQPVWLRAGGWSHQGRPALAPHRSHHPGAGGGRHDADECARGRQGVGDHRPGV